MRLGPHILLLLTMAACGGDPLSSVESGLLIYPSSSVARPGDPLTVHLVNWSGQDLTENLCPLAIQQRQGSSWVSVYSEPLSGGECPAYARFFPAGAAIKRPVTLPVSLPPGQYRVTFQWLGMEHGPALPEDLRASRPFDIRLSLPE
jgi:hypothetical protein